MAHEGSGSSRSGQGSYAALRGVVRGKIVTRAEEAYETARMVWNGLVDRYPEAIAYCTGVEDIVSCARFARERGILTAVRSGGHACAGTAVCDGGLVIDTSLMREVVVDPVRQIVSAQ